MVKRGYASLVKGVGTWGYFGSIGGEGQGSLKWPVQTLGLSGMAKETINEYFSVSVCVWRFVVFLLTKP